MRYKKRILSILISLCLAFNMMTGTVLAADIAPQTQVTKNGTTESKVAIVNSTTEFWINVVHTNDIHARILEDDWNQVIGLPKVKTYIDQASQGKDLSLVLDGGDTFHGQSIATLVRGESAAKVLAACGYDAMAAGNHDWNYGKDRLKELENIVRQNGSPEFSILAGNVVNEDGSMFFDRQYLTKEVVKDGKTLKIGVFGVIDPAIYNATAPGNVEGLQFTDMTVYAQKAAAELKAQGCQIVVGMAHCINPKGLASSVDSVNLWIAGHEHTTINEAVTRPDGGTALVVETGYNLWNFGNVDISCTLDADGNLAEDIKMTENLVDYNTGKALDADPGVQALLDGITEEQKTILSQPAGYAPEDLDGVWEHIRIGETTMGRAVTDAYLLATGADIAFENAGGIRASIEKGAVTYQNVLDVSPYGNYIVTKELSGKEILEILETSLDIMKANIEANEKGDYDGWPDNSGNTLQAGGIEVKYNLSLEKGSRILGVLVQGEAVQGDKMYTVAMNNYLPNDTSDYPQFEGKANLHEYQACEDALAAYLSQPENVVLEGISRARLVATNEKPAVDEKPGQDGNDNQEGSKPKPAVPAPENEKAPDNKTPKNKTPDNKINSVRTGDDVNIELYLLLTLAGIGGAAATLRKKYGTQGN
ncbi:5'-nucleotidase C-terminal domain-containing protein [Faecalicatena orotica]|uniref:2',3'-cyclic-nucleotide 2'-phosphodiesterase (5'-nucleotidase family) n=1 Tax=Faecalicatena orotica TaxID=1544 RepID=A0A2Y9BEW5_9FIRM|nr:bifunctional UDP-sugar hydrolase/5'-nucleotidase [Faecalicatena orotica]PWJ28695.1 2',3'-cyclic-nucleotide 2'-phosphodiesterase (5'-nucleotidase family) [Faecalicatena orotica]SSA56517.1 2',3'-cyclic-nucleotide 2'-phosphodiesterase/5'-or 3'-nucleotidase, 5'-nucleotidase family [Faecalicatena orotica]